MTYEEYKQGLKNLQVRSYLDIRHYNQQVTKECDFKVELQQLLDNLAKEKNTSQDKVKAYINLVDWFADRKTRRGFLGIIDIDIELYNDKYGKPVIEKMGKFRADDNTKFTDGSTLYQNTYYYSDYGRNELRLLPDTDLGKIIIPIEVDQEYMEYPIFVKALFKCDIIENEQTQNFAK